ncbi:MAG: DNA gyrase subunit A, partial [Firmicutes bacterium]|nr:DNA gyrase subunit A [Bacillota bacterium]
EASRTARGTPAVNFLNLLQRERITAVIPVQDFEEDKYLISVTKDGIIKKTHLSEFNTKRTTGLIAINLKDDDQLIAVRETSGTNNVVIVTKNGKCICFNEEDVRPMGRIAGGVRAIKLEADDEVVAMELVEKNQELLVVTENGYGKRTPAKEYKIQVRGGKGILTYDKAKFKKTGELVGAMVVDDDDEVLMINSDGVIIRIKASDVSRLGRATQGVRIMKVEADTNIVSIAKVVKEPEDEEETEAPEVPKKKAKAEKQEDTEEAQIEINLE